MLQRLGMEEGIAIENRLVSRAIERAQKKVEEYNFDMRKRVLEYDEVMDEQRRVIYERRQRALEAQDLKEMVRDMLEESVAVSVESYLSPPNRPSSWDTAGFENWVYRTFDIVVREEELAEGMAGEVEERMVEKVIDAYEARRARLGEESASRVEQFLLLRAIDTKWKDHLYAMDHLMRGIGLRGYGQHDPLVEYKREAFELFEELMAAIRDEITEFIFKLRVEQEDVDSYKGVWQVEREVHDRFEVMRRVQQAAVESSKAPEGKPEPIRVGVKVGRNDPCPCGSGKKFKKCCGRLQR